MSTGPVPASDTGYPVFPAPVNKLGDEGDYCCECGADWKKPHREECSQYLGCLFPPGCPAPAARGRMLCWSHYLAVSALLTPLPDGVGR